MTALNKQALREAAENATAGQWVVELGDEVYAVDGDDSEQIAMVFSDNGRSDAAFIAVASPVAVLSLLDENLQLQRDKDSLEAVAVAMRDDMRDAREKLEAAEKRIAELESNEIREDGNQFLVVRHPGKTPVIKHCSGDLEEFLRNLIEQDPLVTIDIITHRYYGVGGQWVQDADEYLHMMAAAGIGVKGE
ncbi:ead/Ea22-like family protein [Citrobacter braakii]|uniref:ead/Ea22-like family protein n=1 Tax=Citrobacter braakii TaxID=57706 RepID=UPI0039841556